MCLILFIVCKTQDDSVFYNIVQSVMAVNSFHDQIINFSWLNSYISPYYFCGDVLYFLQHMYRKIIGYSFFLLQFVPGLSQIDWTVWLVCLCFMEFPPILVVSPEKSTSPRSLTIVLFGLWNPHNEYYLCCSGMHSYKK